MKKVDVNVSKKIMKNRLYMERIAQTQPKTTCLNFGHLKKADGQGKRKFIKSDPKIQKRRILKKMILINIFILQNLSII